MPYITEARRALIDDEIDALVTAIGQVTNPGTVNYAITRILRGTLLADSPRYEDYNAAIGVLACAQLELYRRHVAPYEDEARERNGDV